MKISVVGIRGIPNNYGGFETLVEYLVQNLSQDFELTVFCSSVDLDTRYESYNNASLKYIPISSHGVKGILYDSISLLKSVKRYDKILLLGFGSGFIIRFLTKYQNKIIVNIGGLDWKRSKWPPLAQKVIKKAEKNLIKYSHLIISDNIGIQKYILDEYNKQSILITYGGDQVKKILPNEHFKNKYDFLKGDYAFSVTRIQPDNNIEMILNAILNQDLLPFVMVGNWDNSEYGKKIKKQYLGLKNLILLDAIYDRNILDVIRSNCKIYIHGHSAGGTNPSLVEAMHLGLPIFAYSSGYNEYTTEEKAIYFHNQQELSNLIVNVDNYDLEGIGADLKKIAQQKYNWVQITNEYKKVFLTK